MRDGNTRELNIEVLADNQSPVKKQQLRLSRSNSGYMGGVLIIGVIKSS